MDKEKSFVAKELENYASEFEELADHIGQDAGYLGIREFLRDTSEKFREWSKLWEEYHDNE